MSRLFRYKISFLQVDSSNLTFGSVSRIPTLNILVWIHKSINSFKQQLCNLKYQFFRNIVKDLWKLSQQLGGMNLNAVQNAISFSFWAFIEKADRNKFHQRKTLWVKKIKPIFAVDLFLTVMHMNAANWIN